jgi:hypothetical protein
MGTTLITILVIIMLDKISIYIYIYLIYEDLEFLSSVHYKFK